MALTDSLVAYYRADESSGDMLDSSGNGRTLAAVNSPGSRGGKLGNARDFVPASSQRFEITAAALGSVFVGTSPWTMAGWILTDDTATIREIAGQFAGTFRGPLLRYQPSAGGVYLQWFNHSNVNFQAIYATPLSAGVWYFVAGTYDPTELKMRLRVNNDAVVLSGTMSGTFAESAASFALGQRGGTGGSFGTYWDGGIDDFGIWSRALTVAELDSLYNSGAGLDPTASSGSAIPLFAAQIAVMS